MHVCMYVCLNVSMYVSVCAVTHSPQLFLQASSLDYWDRHTTHGYGYVNIPCESGMHIILIFIVVHGLPFRYISRFSRRVFSLSPVCPSVCTGCCDIKVSTWEPLGSVPQKLSSFFLGGAVCAAYVVCSLVVSPAARLQYYFMCESKIMS